MRTKLSGPPQSSATPDCYWPFHAEVGRLLDFLQFFRRARQPAPHSECPLWSKWTHSWTTIPYGCVVNTHKYTLVLLTAQHAYQKLKGQCNARNTSCHCKNDCHFTSKLAHDFLLTDFSFALACLLSVIKTWPKSTWGEKGVLIPVHHWGKSSQTQARQEPDGKN